ncbi:MAG: DUF1499 domain-containing protein [Symploca sp. SIO1C2]|nr:DUF1499 domain-containing protein [Symploca sp. SIO1C2]
MISTFFTVIVTLILSFCFSAFPVVASPLIQPYSMAIFGLKGTAPQDLGINKELLKPCPASPNCVISQNGDDTHSIKPITYQTDRETARKVLLKVLTVVPRTTVIEETENYIRTESSSSLLGFVDDGEFYFPEDEKVIHLRSASRLGESDLGVNRRRLEQIRLALQDLGV